MSLVETHRDGDGINRPFEGLYILGNTNCFNAIIVLNKHLFEI